MYSRKRPDSHRFWVGGSFSCLLFWFQIVGHLTFQYYCKSNWHVAHQWRDLIINIKRSRTPKVFEICLIPLQSVLNTDSGESRHTLCVHLLNVCPFLPLHTPRSLHSRGLCPNARSLSANLSPSSPFFFQYFFIGCDPQMYTFGGHLVSIWEPPRLLYHNWFLIRSRTPIRSRFGHRPPYYTTIDFWSGLAHPSDLDLVTAHAIIPQLTSNPISHTHQMPRVV